MSDLIKRVKEQMDKDKQLEVSEEEIENKSRSLSNKIGKLKLEEKKLNKELKKVQKQIDDRKKAKEQKFYDKIYELYKKTVVNSVKEIDGSYWDDYWNDDMPDQRMVHNMTEEAEHLQWNWDEHVNEAIECAESESKRAKEHLEGLKKFKIELNKIKNENQKQK